MKRPNATAGLHHVALYVSDLDACERFYVELMGMSVEWRPDPDNLYLSSGTDNLALHRGAPGFNPTGSQRLDHIGFIVDRPEDVDDWFGFLQSEGVAMRSEPKTHRDGARSFYCSDPCGNTVQIIFHPPISLKKGTSSGGDVR